MQGRNIAEILTGAVVVLVAAAFLVFAIGQSGRSLVGGGGGITLSAKFDRIDGLTPGADVRIGGVKVGSVVEQHIDPRTYRRCCGCASLPTSPSPTTARPRSPRRACWAASTWRWCRAAPRPC
ncbi:MlaD family protein [Teichococcus aestuarii]|uniref:MlaD family protein n=1 Tax=Teichococcus aestuarii TaxID=568898 RepID=UPI003621F3A6